MTFPGIRVSRCHQMERGILATSQVKQDPTPVRYRQDRDLDILQIEFLRSVILIIQESILLVIGILVVSILRQDVIGQITFNGIFTPFRSSSSRSSVLIGDYLTIPPKLDKAVREDAAMATAVSVVICHSFPWDNRCQTFGSASCDSPLAPLLWSVFCI